MPLLLSIEALVTRSKLRRVSLLNRLNDYEHLDGKGSLLDLHLAMNSQLLAADREWHNYDYGEGYFYQGLDSIQVSGLRDTRGRVGTMQLRERLKGKSVLEIGCNTGFLSLSFADVAKRVVGFDVNPYLLNIGRSAAEFLGFRNVSFLDSAFEDYSSDDSFDVVMSFANHSTYDGNTHQSINEYFSRCRHLVAPGGQLLFESHPPQHEGAGLEQVCGILEQHFEVKERAVLEYGTFLDRGRTFITAGVREQHDDFTSSLTRLGIKTPMQGDTNKEVASSQAVRRIALDDE